MTDKINTTETGISIWEVVGIDDLEGNTFAQCTCKKNAEKHWTCWKDRALKMYWKSEKVICF